MPCPFLGNISEIEQVSFLSYRLWRVPTGRFTMVGSSPRLSTPRKNLPKSLPAESPSGSGCCLGGCPLGGCRRTGYSPGSRSADWPPNRFPLLEARSAAWVCCLVLYVVPEVQEQPQQDHQIHQGTALRRSIPWVHVECVRRDRGPWSLHSVPSLQSWS